MYKVVYISVNNRESAKEFKEYNEALTFINKIKGNKLLKMVLPIFENVNGEWVSVN